MAGASGLLRVVLVGGIAFGAYWLGTRASSAPRLSEGEVLADGQTVVVAVRELARLETVAFHMERIVDFKHRQSRLFGLIQADDAILLIAAGDVIAGIDLGQLRPEDVTVDPTSRRATLDLPAPAILSARLDNERTRVYRRETDTLAQRADSMETRARQIAEQEIRRAALAAGILEQARRGAERTLRALVQSLGFREVEIRFRAGLE